VGAVDQDRFKTVDVSGTSIISAVPADTVTTPTDVDLSSYVPAGTRWVLIRWQGYTSSGTKILYARENGSSATGAAAEKCRIPHNSPYGFYMRNFIVSLDSSRICEMWWSNTTTLTSRNMCIEAYGNGDDP
jgi:hypothetical protein